MISHENGSFLPLAVALLIVGLGTKTAFFPLHTWLPSAHGEAPTPVSAILSGVMIKISFLAMWRILSFVGAVEFETFLLWGGVATALVGVVMAIIQIDIKRLLACHSVSQMGIIVAAFGAGHSLGRTSSLLHLMNHSLFKSLLFLSAGIIILRTGKRKIGSLSGVMRQMPVPSICLLVGACAIAGVPGFNGFVSKNWVSQSLKNHYVAYCAIFLTNALTATSMLKLASILWGRSGGNAPLKATNPFLVFPSVSLACFCLLLGVLPATTIGSIKNMLGFGGMRLFAGALYSYRNIISSAGTLGLGAIFYFCLLSTSGQHIAHRLESKRLGLNAKLLLAIASVIAFSIILGK